MGGSALKNIETRRYLKDEYFALVADLLPKLKDLLKTECVLVESYADKDSFGDMDILVQTGGQYTVEEMIRMVKDLLKPPPTDTFKNSNVFSFDHNELQIDLIFTAPENMYISYVFSKFGDVGNLLGKIGHKFNTKYGFDGLRYVYRTAEERVLGEIMLSKDPEKIFNFLGADFERWKQGFNTAEEVFDYVISSKYFDADSFKLENLNAINRKRNKKRKMYNAFIEYCAEKKPVSRYTFNSDRNSYQDMIEEHFPGFKDQLREMEKEETRRKMLREKFNGDMVMAKFPELIGASLGKALGDFKNSQTDFDVYLHQNSSDQIMNDFSHFLANRAN
jgi:hypothetical protein